MLGHSNPTVAIRLLDGYEKAKSDLGSGRLVNLISESGLYKLVMRSEKPQAKAFQDWVKKDVLPAIRKDGGYIMGEEKVATGEMSEDEKRLVTSQADPQIFCGTKVWLSLT